MRNFKFYRFKKLSIPQSIISLIIVLFFFMTGCEKNEIDKTPPPDFYEFGITSGDSFVTFTYNFPGLVNEKYGIEITYYIDGIKKVQQEFGAFSITIDGLTNNETYTFTIVIYDNAGNRSDPSEVKATPNTPFILLSPTKPDDYTIEDGKIKIDLLFNRQADTNEFISPLIEDIINLHIDSSPVTYTTSWLEDGQVFSIMTTDNAESLCKEFPCNMDLKITSQWIGNMVYDGFQDTNGMLLDGDKDGEERGDAELTLIIEL